MAVSLPSRFPLDKLKQWRYDLIVLNNPVTNSYKIKHKENYK